MANLKKEERYKPTIDRGIYDQLSSTAQAYYTPTSHAGMEYQDTLIGQYARGTQKVYEPVFTSLESKGFAGQLGAGVLGYSALPHVSVVRAYPEKGASSFTQLVPHFGQTLAPTVLNWKDSPWYSKAMGIGFAAAPFLPSPTPLVARAFTKVTGRKPWSIAQVAESMKPVGRMTVPVKTGTFDMTPVTGELTPIMKSVNVWTGLKFGRRPVVGVSQGRLAFGTRGIRGVPAKDIGFRGETASSLWQPVTPLQTTIFKAKITGLASAETAKIQTALSTSQAYKGKPSPHIDVRNVELPPVRSLSDAGSRAVFEWTSEQGGRIKMTYGSGSIIPQLEKSLAKVRGPAGDIDIQSSWTPEGALLQTQRLLKILQKTEGAKNVRISSEFPTLIETRTPGGQWVHAIDMHAAGSGSLLTSPYQSGQASWGRLYAETPIKVTTASGKLKFMTISESGARKTGSITQIGEGTVGPQAHRVKDVLDAYYIARSQGVPVKEFAKAWGLSEADINTAIKAGVVFEFGGTPAPPISPVIPVAPPSIAAGKFTSPIPSIASPGVISPSIVSPSVASMGIASPSIVASYLPSPSPISSVSMASISPSSSVRTSIGLQPSAPIFLPPSSYPSPYPYVSPSPYLPSSVSPSIPPSTVVPSGYVPPSTPYTPPYEPYSPYSPPVPPSEPPPPIIPPPVWSGLGGGVATTRKGYMPQDLGYWEFGEFYSGVHPLTGKLVKVRSKKRIKYGDVPRTVTRNSKSRVIRSRVDGGDVGSDSPYYKGRYSA